MSLGEQMLPPAQDGDAWLVERAIAGEQAAFGLLVTKYRRRIQRLIGRIVRDVDLVEDITQETFVRAYKALPNFRGDAQFYTWLYRIAVNSAKKALVELKRDPLIFDSSQKKSGDDDETSQPQDELTTHETPETLYAANEVAQAVNSALLQLPDDLRQAITLREIEGLSYEEIAIMMGCPVGTVRSRIFRAREAIADRLRPLLDKRGGKRW